MLSDNSTLATNVTTHLGMGHLDLVTLFYSLTFLFIGSVNLIYNWLTRKDGLKSAYTILILYSSISALWLENALYLFYALEVTSILGFLIVSTSETGPIGRISVRYLLWHVAAGMMIIVLVAFQLSSASEASWSKSMNFYHFDSYLKFIQASRHGSAGGWGRNFLMHLPIAGILMLCAVFPFSAWFTRTYVHLDSSSIILLSVITTKTALFVLLKLFHQASDFAHSTFPVSIISISSVLTVVIATLMIAISTKVFNILLNLSLVSIGFSIFGIISMDGTKSIIPISTYIMYSAISLTSVYLIYGYIVKYSSGLMDSNIRHIPDLLKKSILHSNYSGQFFFIILISSFFAAGLPITHVASVKHQILESIQDIGASGLILRITSFLIQHSQIPLMIGAIKLVLPFYSMRGGAGHDSAHQSEDVRHGPKEIKTQNRQDRIQQERGVLILCWSVIVVLILINIITLVFFGGAHGFHIKAALVSTSKFIIYGMLGLVIANIRFSSKISKSKLSTREIGKRVSKLILYLLAKINLIFERTILAIAKYFALTMGFISRNLNDIISYNLTLDKTVLLSFVLILFLLIA